MKNIHIKLSKIQRDLKAPKSQRNTFGNYNYRNSEDILEAVKPLLGECTLVISDEIVNLGERYYVKATCKLSDGEDTIENTAYARESLEKKGMDSSQITGAASSYARKYALNGLFAIDDTKDADHDDAEKATGRRVTPVATPAPKPVVQHSENGNIPERQVTTDTLYCAIHDKPMKERPGKAPDHRWQVNGVWQQCEGRVQNDPTPDEYQDGDY